MSKIKAILFDLDGTLINTPQLIMHAFRETIKKFYPDLTLEETEVTNVLGQTLDSTFEKYAKDENEINEMIETYRNYSSDKSFKLEGFKHLEKVLIELKNKGYLVGIVTSKTDYVVFDNLEELNIENLFDCIITHQDTNIHKPNPEPILLALEKLGVNNTEAIYIGDHENDIVAGRNALVQTGLMGYSHRLEEAKLESPNYIFKDLKEIIKKIDKE